MKQLQLVQVQSGYSLEFLSLKLLSKEALQG
jgi:hypothetical protein